jgi:MFS family permease
MNIYNDRKDAMKAILQVWPALRYRNFRLFAAGQSVSVIGTWMTTAATGWLVYRLTHSAFLLGAVGFASQIPCLFLAPFIGVWVDRQDRRRVLIWTQALSMIQSLLLAYLTMSSHVTIHWVLWLSLAQGVVTAFDFPARHSFLVEMIDDRRDMGNAIAINSTMFNAARLIGPSLAGVLIAATNEGWCFLLDGVSYAAVIASLLAIRPHSRSYNAGQASAWAAFQEGWRYVSGEYAIRTILLFVTLIGLMAIPYTVLMPVFAGEILHGGANTLGFLMGAMGLGSLISALSLTFRKSVHGLTKMIPIAGVAFGASLIGFGLSRRLWISLAMMVFVGFGLLQCISVCNTIIQMLAGDERRGRVMSFFTMAYVGMPPVGCLIVGSMALRLGAPGTVILLGAAVAAGAIWFALRLPAMARAMRPIYQKMGIIPADLPALVEEAGEL